jgi:hypothetical protein
VHRTQRSGPVLRRGVVRFVRGALGAEPARPPEVREASSDARPLWEGATMIVLGLLVAVGPGLVMAGLVIATARLLGRPARR